MKKKWKKEKKKHPPTLNSCFFHYPTFAHLARRKYILTYSFRARFLLRPSLFGASILFSFGFSDHGITYLPEVENFVVSCCRCLSFFPFCSSGRTLQNERLALFLHWRHCFRRNYFWIPSFRLPFGFWKRFRGSTTLRPFVCFSFLLLIFFLCSVCFANGIFKF